MKQKKSIYNFANFLSISRIFIAGPLVVCFENLADPFYFKCSILIIVYIVLSDMLDGYFARISNCVTDFGKIIDPIADKVCFLVVLIYLIDSFDNINYIINPFVIIYIMLAIRDTLLISLSLYNILFKGYVSQANKSGKFFIFLSSLMVIFYIYDINSTLALFFYGSSLLMLVVSTIEYILEYKRISSR
tara:strand:- start:774 stop:1340 length:567 start_codon:yes stop_codon:yes gene_type:complete